MRREVNQWDLNALFKSEEHLERFIAANTRKAKQFAKIYEQKLDTI